jgi:hypothetical protein
MAGTINISGSIASDPGGSRTIGPFVIQLPNPRLVILQPSLAIGNNGPFSIPSGTTYVLITMPTSSLGVVTLKGATIGDVGFPLLNTGPSFIGLDPTATALNLNATVAIPSQVEIAFY